ncbi:PREDICTED: uncharacterized protein LOC104601045 isoform X1 [Nelumbo nucifera]|uniref:Uncharacterized protein LOC104601045 isoform X1 n=1 Tax=Nelumbo nucifera TaxID=4432 RepID=A0A1U8AJT6_NELNU|nr:PREDICTED: uncharacterized protein LOC104601045 isoform X1 [Nelumbo nucifera]
MAVVVSQGPVSASSLLCNCHRILNVISLPTYSLQNPCLFDSTKPQALATRKQRTSCLSSRRTLYHLQASPQRGRLLTVSNGLGEDSDEKIVEDDDVKDLGVKAALVMLKFYKMGLKPKLGFQAGEISPLLPNSCRYVPTCSEYSMEAYKRYGVIKGTILTAWRLCRCNPLGGSGFDPPRWFDERNSTEG